MTKNNAENPVDSLVALKDYDPTNLEHASIIAKALLKLYYCADTMVLLLERTGQTDRKDHKKTFDGFNTHR